jgi:beta-alanine degradation protein BauB
VAGTPMDETGGGAPASAVTPTAVTPTAATPTAVSDNDRARVTTWTFRQAGAATGQHRHESDYIVVPVTGGTFRVTGADGSVSTMTQVAGVPYLRPAGTTHDVASTSGQEAVFVEIELKR